MPKETARAHRSFSTDTCKFLGLLTLLDPFLVWVTSATSVSLCDLSSGELLLRGTVAPSGIQTAESASGLKPVPRTRGHLSLAQEPPRTVLWWTATGVLNSASSAFRTA